MTLGQALTRLIPTLWAAHDIFTVHGPWIGRDSAVVDLGLTAYCTPGLSAYIFYDGQFGRDNYNNNAISGGFRVAF